VLSDEGNGAAVPVSDTAHAHALHLPEGLSFGHPRSSRILAFLSCLQRRRLRLTVVALHRCHESAQAEGGGAALKT
jgi:hypothetical protein